MVIRLGLLGTTGHWRTYEQVLHDLPDAAIVAVAPAAPEEKPEAFDGATGITAQTRRYPDPLSLLQHEAVDIVQVCTRPDLMPALTLQSIDHGVAVMAEKPLAMDLATLHEIWERAHTNHVLVLPMHTHRGDPIVATVQAAVQRGEIGEPLCSTHQKSYKWGKRAEYHRSRAQFPGIAPFIGIHAFDWMVWILGDVFTQVIASESASGHPDFPATASQAGYLFTMQNGGVATVTLDFLRPASAPTHGDERIRIAGTRGVIEARAVERRVFLINEDGSRELELIQPISWYTQFVEAALGRQSEPPMTMQTAFRITEIALKAQQSADEQRLIALRNSPYAPA